MACPLFSLGLSAAEGRAPADRIQSRGVDDGTFPASSGDVSVLAGVQRVSCSCHIRTSHMMSMFAPTDHSGRSQSRRMDSAVDRCTHCHRPSAAQVVWTSDYRSLFPDGVVMTLYSARSKSVRMRSSPHILCSTVYAPKDRSMRCGQQCLLWQPCTTMFSIVP